LLRAFADPQDGLREFENTLEKFTLSTKFTLAETGTKNRLLGEPETDYVNFVYLVLSY
jgi:hypothetical protein